MIAIGLSIFGQAASLHQLSAMEFRGFLLQLQGLPLELLPKLGELLVILFSHSLKLILEDGNAEILYPQSIMLTAQVLNHKKCNLQKGQSIVITCPIYNRELKLTRMVSFSNDSNMGPGHNSFKFL